MSYPTALYPLEKNLNHDYNLLESRTCLNKGRAQFCRGSKEMGEMVCIACRDFISRYEVGRAALKSRPGDGLVGKIAEVMTRIWGKS